MKKEQLFLLIKSLNKGEKSYFKKFSSRHTAHGNNNYIKLFNAIDKQKEYNEQKLKEDLKSETIIKNLSSAKFYLLKLIIQCLTSFHSEEGIDYRIKEMMQNIEILGKKNHHALQLNILDKAKELALKYERYPLLIELIFIERIALLEGGDVKKLEEFFKTFSEKIERYSELIVNNSKVFAAKKRMTGLHNMIGSDREEEQALLIDTIFKNEVLPLNELTLSFGARYNLMSTHYFYYGLKNDFISAYDYSKKAMDIWETNNDMINQGIPYYAVSIQNYLSSCLNVCKFDEFDLVMKKLKNIPKKFPGADTGKLKLKIFDALHLELNKYLQMGCFTEGKKCIPEIEKGLIELEGKYTKWSEMATLFNTAYVYFGAGEFKIALQWARKIIHNPVPNVRVDLQICARMLSIMSYIELEDKDMVEYLLRSTLRFTHKKERLYKVESLMLNFFKDYLNHNNRVSLTKKLENLKMDLEVAHLIPGEKNAFYDIDFLSWVESKVNKQIFEKIVQEKAMEKQKEMEVKLKEYFSDDSKKINKQLKKNKVIDIRRQDLTL